MDERQVGKVIRAAQNVIQIAGRLEELGDLEMREAAMREPEHLATIAGLELERDKALLLVSQRESETQKAIDHLNKVRAELTKTQQELQSAQNLLREIGARVEKGT